jgi:hypothetical protein
MAKCSTCPVGSFRGGDTITLRQDPDPECDHDWLSDYTGPAICTKCGTVMP